MTATEHFQLIFPSHRLFVYEDGELRYRFPTEQIGRIYERMAQKVILKNQLRVTAVLEVWSVGGLVKEVCLVVKAVPEEDLVEQL